MSERDPLLLIEDIKASIRNILDFTKGMTYDLYESDIKTKHAVERNFEIIGEAVSRLSEQFKTAHPHIEDRQAGLYLKAINLFYTYKCQLRRPWS